MAASTDKMVKSKSGKMYESSSPQGKMIVTAATKGSDADFGPSGPDAKFGSDTSMAETLQLIYGETQDSAESLDNIEESLVEGTEETAEERAARLKKSNKEKSEKYIEEILSLKQELDLKYSNLQEENNFLRIKFNDAGDESVSHTLKAYRLIDNLLDNINILVYIK